MVPVLNRATFDLKVVNKLNVAGVSKVKQSFKMLVFSSPFSRCSLLHSAELQGSVSRQHRNSVTARMEVLEFQSCL